MHRVDLNERQQLHLLLVAGRKHLSRGDLRALVQYLETEDCGFHVTLELSDPGEQPELLELHRLVAIPALIKLAPAPKQIFAGSSIFHQLKSWLPRWQQEEFVSGLGLSSKPTTLDSKRTQRELLLEDELLVLRQENETLINRIDSQERYRYLSYCAIRPIMALELIS